MEFKTIMVDIETKKSLEIVANGTPLAAMLRVEARRMLDAHNTKTRREIMVDTLIAQIAKPGADETEAYNHAVRSAFLLTLAEVEADVDPSWAPPYTELIRRTIRVIQARDWENPEFNKAMITMAESELQLKLKIDQDTATLDADTREIMGQWERGEIPDSGVSGECTWHAGQGPSLLKSTGPKKGKNNTGSPIVDAAQDIRDEDQGNI